eukprot:14808415-Ditylum_brightwellii.AAC.1
MRLLDLESTVLPQLDHLFPVAVALDEHGHSTQGTSPLMGIPHPGNGEDIYSTSEDAHHLKSNHNTTFKRHSKGPANGNVNSENISSTSRESPHIVKKENHTDLMRDHQPPIQ